MPETSAGSSSTCILPAAGAIHFCLVLRREGSAGWPFSVNYSAPGEGRFNPSFIQQTLVEEALHAGTVLGTGDPAVNNTKSCLHEASIPVERQADILKSEEGERREEVWAVHF